MDMPSSFIGFLLKGTKPLVRVPNSFQLHQLMDCISPWLRPPGLQQHGWRCTQSSEIYSPKMHWAPAMCWVLVLGQVRSRVGPGYNHTTPPPPPRFLLFILQSWEQRGMTALATSCQEGTASQEECKKAQEICLEYLNTRTVQAKITGKENIV